MATRGASARAPLFAAALALYAVACGDHLFTIHIRDSSSIVVAKGTLLETFAGNMGFGDFVSMDITDYAEIQNQGVEPGDIARVTLEKFSLDAGDATLSFLTSVDLYVEAPGLSRQLVASASDFAGKSRVEFEMTGFDMTDYVVSESMSFITDADGKRPDQDTELVAAFDLAVEVTGQGACNQISKK